MSLESHKDPISDNYMFIEPNQQHIPNFDQQPEISESLQEKHDKKKKKKKNNRIHYKDTNHKNKIIYQNLKHIYICQN